DPSSIAVGAERQGVDLTLVSPEDLEFLAGLDVPDLDRVLLTSRRQPPPVRAEGHVHTRPGDPRAKSSARSLLLVEAHRVPELDLPVAARRSQVPAVAAKDQSADFPSVGTEHIILADRLPGPCIPYVHGSIASSRDQVAAVGAESHCAVWQGLFCLWGREAEACAFGLRVPDPNGIDTNGIGPRAERSDEMAFGVPGRTARTS